MKTNPSNRLVQSYETTLPATADRIFPLLCPVREYEWIAGWECDLIHTASGVAENNCIFRTNDPAEGELTWVVSRYEPDRAIEFVISRPDLLIIKLDLQLAENGDGTTIMTATHTITGLNETGDAVVALLPDNFTRDRWKGLSDALAHYLRTGRMLMKSVE